MLDGCSIGDVFQSPSAEQMLAVTREIDQGAGVLYIYGNYNGDIFNFDMAAEMADMEEDIRVESVVAGEDVASAGPSAEGEPNKRRGVAGIFFVYKCAGAAAAAGLDLDEDVYKRQEQVVLDNKDKSVPELKELLHKESVAIKDEDVWMCRQIGEYGLTLIKDGDGILTHCNAGQLATSKYGTALAPIHLGRERGMNFRVYTDETRPLLQGARLSAFEMQADGVDTTVICDNMASQVMKNGWVNAVFVGCDRVAANGDACNKIGTSGVAILAKYYGIPFYVLGPTSTIDMSIARGEDITIEQRPAEEVTEMWYKRRMAPEGVKVYNPAFDFADNELIAGIVTEYGIARPPYNESLKEIFKKKAEAEAAKKK